MFTHISFAPMRNIVLSSTMFLAFTLPAFAEPAPIPGEVSQAASQVVQSSTRMKWPKLPKLGSTTDVVIKHPNQAVFEDKIQALLAQPKTSETATETLQQLYVEYSVMETTPEARNALFKAYYNAMEAIESRLEDEAFEGLKPASGQRLPSVDLLHQALKEGNYYYELNHQEILDRLPQTASTPAIVYFLSLNAMHDTQAPFDDGGVLITWPQLAYTLEGIQRFKRYYPEFGAEITPLEMMYTNALLGKFDNSPLHEGVLTETNQLPLRPGVREGLELYLKHCRGAAAYGTVKSLYDQLKLNNFIYKASLAPTETLR